MPISSAYPLSAQFKCGTASCSLPWVEVISCIVCQPPLLPSEKGPSRHYINSVYCVCVFHQIQSSCWSKCRPNAMLNNLLIKKKKNSAIFLFFVGIFLYISYMLPWYQSSVSDYFWGNMRGYLALNISIFTWTRATQFRIRQKAYTSSPQALF